jgi:hypothetical protein
LAERPSVKASRAPAVRQVENFCRRALRRKAAIRNIGTSSRDLPRIPRSSVMVASKTKSAWRGSPTHSFQRIDLREARAMVEVLVMMEGLPPASRPGGSG